MSSKKPIGIIELGDQKIKCIIFTINNVNNTEILSTSIISSEGIRNGTIVNLTKASNSIRSCIGIAEKKANVSLKKINVIFEQAEFLCTKFSKHKKISGAKIYKEDIEFLLKEAKKQLILNDKNQSIIHIFNHNYNVDGKTFLKEPINVYADFLSHEMTFVTAPKNNIKNVRQAFIDCDIEIEKLISNTFALSVQFLNQKELEYGSILINVGFEKTSLGLFKNLALSHSITLPIGNNHITKDISKVCSLNLDESEIIKNNIDFSFADTQKIFDKKGFLKDTYFIESNIRKISRDLLLSIVKARLDEIFGIIKKHIITTRFNLTSEINIFLTEGSSNLYNLDKYCENFFKTNIKKILENDQNFEVEDLGKNFSSCLGGIKIIKDGWETEAIPVMGKKSDEKKGFFAKLFGINQ